MIELFPDTSQHISDAFRALCTGKRGNGLHYKGHKLFSVTRKGIVGDRIPVSKTPFITCTTWDFLKRNQPCTVSMSPMNGCFAIECSDASINKKLVEIRQVMEGFDVMKAVSNVGFDASGMPSVPVVVADCGEVM